MRLPIEWITEYAPVEASAEEIAHALTMAGLEVEETEQSAIGPVLNITVTPNRGDCLSAIGVAREITAAYGVELKRPAFPASIDPGAAAGLTSVTIADPDLCPRYAARIIRDVKPSASPDWMQARLTAAGMRSIGGIVDVTNYVMLEMGQPLHAFDYDTLSEHRIVVRRARPGETLKTLDGFDRNLSPDMLMICDAAGPVAVAGVMGGGPTEMSESTRTVLLESAHFGSLSIRRTSRTLELRTEASYRFERVVDPNLVVAAADRACALMSELGLGEVVEGVVDVYPAPLPDRILPARPERISLILGFDVTCALVTETLGRLGFEQATGTPTHPHTHTPTPHFTVPTWRPDIVREIDLAEEVGRVLGYERIPERLPHGSSTQGFDSARARFAERVRETLAGAGLQEIVSHSLLAPGKLDDPRDDADIAIRSALSAELSSLRRSLIPGLVDAMERNARRGQTPLAFFEIGHVFRRHGESYQESTHVAAALVGPLLETSWHAESRRAQADFYMVRGLVERLASVLHLPNLRFAPGDHSRLHPGRSAVIQAGEDGIGVAGELHPDLTADLTIRDRVAIFELDLDALELIAGQRVLFTALTPFPAVTRDLAPRVRADIQYAQVQEAIGAVRMTMLENMALTDVFTGSPLPDGVKSLTLTFTFRALDRTLTDEEVNGALATLRARLEAACGATFPA